MNQSKSQILGRRTDGTAAAASVADEIRHVGPVTSLEHMHAAVLDNAVQLASMGERDAAVAGRRPFPDVAAEILNAKRVGTVVAAGLRLGIGGAPGRGFLWVSP